MCLIAGIKNRCLANIIDYNKQFVKIVFRKSMKQSLAQVLSFNSQISSQKSILIDKLKYEQNLVHSCSKFGVIMDLTILLPFGNTIYN